MTLGLPVALALLVLFVWFLMWLGGLARTYGPLSWILVIPILIAIVIYLGPFGAHLLVAHGTIWLQVVIIAIFLCGFWEAEPG